MDKYGNIFVLSWPWKGKCEKIFSDIKHTLCINPETIISVDELTSIKELKKFISGDINFKEVIEKKRDSLTILLKPVVDHVGVVYTSKKPPAFTFSNCKKLKKVILPDMISHIDRSTAFKRCENLEEVVLPKNLKSILCFSYCKKLKKITLPENFTEISYVYKTYEKTFEGCTNLGRVG